MTREIYSFQISVTYMARYHSAFFFDVKLSCEHDENIVFCRILPVIIGEGETPVPIPNTTVKTSSADGSAAPLLRESRLSPAFIFLFIISWG